MSGKQIKWVVFNIFLTKKYPLAQNWDEDTIRGPVEALIKGGIIEELLREKSTS